MQDKFETLDNLLYVVLNKLVKIPFNIKASRGHTSEIPGALLTLTNPRARLSLTETKGTPFSAVGELLWYLSGKNELEFIAYYLSNYKKESSDGKTIHGGYGPRLFNSGGKINQVQNIIDLLREKKSTRRAVIQLFEARDINAPQQGNSLYLYSSVFNQG